MTCLRMLTISIRKLTWRCRPWVRRSRQVMPSRLLVRKLTTRYRLSLVARRMRRMFRVALNRVTMRTPRTFTLDRIGRWDVTWWTALLYRFLSARDTLMCEEILGVMNVSDRLLWLLLRRSLVARFRLTCLKLR